MIYEKKTLELLADQRLLSRHNKKVIISDNNINNNNNNNIIKNINNNYSMSSNKFSNILKYMNFIILLLYLSNFKNYHY